MTPEDVKNWVEIVSIPAILLGVFYAMYRSTLYARQTFIDPFGGPDGILAHYFERTGKSIEQMPHAVAELNDNIVELGQKQIDELQTLRVMHDDPEATFSTVKTNEMIKDIMRAKCIMSELLTEIADKNHVETRGALEDIKRILSKHID